MWLWPSCLFIYLCISQILQHHSGSFLHPHLVSVNAGSTELSTVAAFLLPLLSHHGLPIYQSLEVRRKREREEQWGAGADRHLLPEQVRKSVERRSFTQSLPLGFLICRRGQEHQEAKEFRCLLAGLTNSTPPHPLEL